MLRLDNGGGAMGDVSYLTPEAAAAAMPTSWRFCISGTEGYIEVTPMAKTVSVYRTDEKSVLEVPAADHRVTGTVDDFLADLSGAPNPEGLHTARVLESSRMSLLAQQAADNAD